MIGFAHSNRGGGTDNKAIKVSQDLTNNLTAVNGALDKMDADGGTNYTAALQKAYDFLNDRTNCSINLLFQETINHLSLKNSELSTIKG